MINQPHVQGSKEDIQELLNEKKPVTHEMSLKDTLRFYLDDPNYTEVHVVSCNKCGEVMCIEVYEPRVAPQYYQTHHQGRRRITVGDADYPYGRLLSHRKRLDGAMGYRCICGNNTINSKPELGLLPTVTNPSGPAAIPTIEPHHEAAVRLEIARSGYKPDIEISGNKVRVETFTIEQVK